MGDTDSPRRLIYGPAPFAGYEGVVLDAETAERWGAASHARTWGQFARAMHGMTWDEFVASHKFDDDDSQVGAGDAFEFEEWLSETWDTGPQEIAHDIAAHRLAELIADRPAELSGVKLGGGSPAGNINVFSGPLDQLALVASLIDPARDGFLLERDDRNVEHGMFSHLYGYA